MLIQSTFNDIFTQTILLKTVSHFKWHQASCLHSNASLSNVEYYIVVQGTKVGLIAQFRTDRSHDRSHDAQLKGRHKLTSFNPQVLQGHGWFLCLFFLHQFKFTPAVSWHYHDVDIELSPPVEISWVIFLHISTEILPGAQVSWQQR